MKYVYCPICGRELGKMDSWDEGEVPYCANDNMLFFDVPKPCIMVAVIKNDEILLLKQSYIYKNSKVLISGYIGIDEKAEEAVYREVLEETSIQIKDVEFLGTDFVEDKEILMLTYKANYKSGIIKKSDEVEMAGWIKLNSALEEMKEDVLGKRVLRKILKIRDK